MISALALLIVVGLCLLACRVYARARGLPPVGWRTEDDLDAELADLLDAERRRDDG